MPKYISSVTDVYVSHWVNSYLCIHQWTIFIFVQRYGAVAGAHMDSTSCLKAAFHHTDLGVRNYGLAIIVAGTGRCFLTFADVSGEVVAMKRVCICICNKIHQWYCYNETCQLDPLSVCLYTVKYPQWCKTQRCYRIRLSKTFSQFFLYGCSRANSKDPMIRTMSGIIHESLNSRAILNRKITTRMMK